MFGTLEGILIPLGGAGLPLSARVRLVISRLALIFVLPLDFHGRVRVVRTTSIPCALHGVEATHLSKGSFSKVRTAILRAVWSRKQPPAGAGDVSGLLDGPQGCDRSGSGYSGGTSFSELVRLHGSIGFWNGCKWLPWSWSYSRFGCQCKAYWFQVGPHLWLDGSGRDCLG